MSLSSCVLFSIYVTGHTHLAFDPANHLWLHRLTFKYVIITYQSGYKKDNHLKITKTVEIWFQLLNDHNKKYSIINYKLKSWKLFVINKVFQSWKLFGRKLFGPCVNFGNFMAGNFLGGNFLAGNCLSHVVIFGNFMAGNFLGGNFLGRIQFI